MLTRAPHSFSLAKRTSRTLAALAVAASPLTALATAKVVSDVPAIVARSASRGPIAAGQDLRVTLWLTMRDRAGFDKAVEERYTPGSATFHQWMSTDELLAYAPTAAQVKQVKEELSRQGLTVIEDGRDGFSIAVHGPAAAIEAAFHTRIETFESNGRLFHANTTEASLEGAAGALVENVSGLSNLGMKPQIAYVKDPKTNQPRKPVALSAYSAAANRAASGAVSDAAPNAAATSGTTVAPIPLFSNHCFETPATFTFNEGGLPVGIYFGNTYLDVPRVCGYTPVQMQQVYGLPAAYKAGLSGQGQTIVIVDAYGSPTIQGDANIFNSRYGLPTLGSSNFKVTYPSGQPLDPALGIQEGWNVETSLDVEWAHAIAPQAKIVLLAAAAQDDQDLQYAVEYATVHKLGSVISNSYSSPEVEDGPAALNAYDQVIEMAAAAGISVNYSTGDHGDLGVGSPVGAASVPGDSPYATAVGGTSIGIPGGVGFAQETGWGNNQTLLATGPKSPLDPPESGGNVGGSGGGQSVYFAKPAYQKSLPGKYRLMPDVAMDADPYTGAVIVYTQPGSPAVEEIGSIGGTSLSTPMFSAFWALANQKAGRLLGQAAPIISQLNAAALNDVVPVGSTTNVTGTVIDASGATFYSATDLAAPLEGTTDFYSAVWPIDGDFVNLTFGTDTSLKTAKGWDDVTGYGSPIGLGFVTAAAKQ